MDEKKKEIEQIICRYWDTAKWTNWMQLAAIDIAALFEREREKLKEYAWHKKDCPVRTLVAAAWLPSQDVMKAARMRCNCGYFKAIGEKQAEIANPTESDG